MMNEANKIPTKEDKDLATGTGNASNPTPRDESLGPEQTEQLIDPRGEKYLREVASPEDYPDARDMQDMDDAYKAQREEDTD